MVRSKVGRSVLRSETVPALACCSACSSPLCMLLTPSTYSRFRKLLNREFRLSCVPCNAELSVSPDAVSTSAVGVSGRNGAPCQDCAAVSLFGCSRFWLVSSATDSASDSCCFDVQIFAGCQRSGGRDCSAWRGTSLSHQGKSAGCFAEGSVG